MNEQAEKLSRAFISDFWSANHEITWTAVEEERQLWLAPNVLLVGRVDARGLTSDGLPFFGEWKTASASKARRMNDEKLKWRTDPQALTYGVLLDGLTDRFTVRWALKTPQPATDFEWYTYTPEEVKHWRSTLLNLAGEIARDRVEHPEGPWLTNRGNCYRYGVAYKCPFIEGCHALDFARVYGAPRTPHLEFERSFDNRGGEVVVIDASRIGDYLECPESYRKKWEAPGFHEENDNLVIGSEFHSLVATHLRTLIAPPNETKEIENANAPTN